MLYFFMSNFVKQTLQDQCRTELEKMTETEAFNYYLRIGMISVKIRLENSRKYPALASFRESLKNLPFGITSVSQL